MSPSKTTIRSRVLAGAMLALACGMVFGAAPRGKGDAELEATVARLVKQLGADAWRARRSASERLTAMGVKIIPLLAKYRGHPDAEIAARVQAIIDSYAWMDTGVLVIRTLPHSQAVRLKVRIGDVFVRVDDLDITSLEDLQRINYDRPRTYHTRRGERIFPMLAGPGKVGAYCRQWRHDQGGQAHASGLAALAQGQFDAAYKHLQAAHAAGMREPWTLMRLWGLAEYQLDHARAEQIHKQFLASYPTFACEWSHVDIDRSNFHLPMSSTYTAHLLRRQKTDKLSADLYHRLTSYFTGVGRNLPLARTVTAAKPPAVEGTDPHHVAWWSNARMAIAMHDGRWKDALADLHVTPTNLWGPSMAVRAAIHLHQVDRAGKTAQMLVAAYERPPRGIAAISLTRLLLDDTKNDDRRHLIAAVHAVAAALADGKRDLARKLVDALAESHLAALNDVFGRAGGQICGHVSAAAQLPALLEKHLGGREHEHLDKAMLDMTFHSPALTAQRWRSVLAGHAGGKRYAAHFRRLRAAALLRFGQYAAARRAAEAAGIPRDDPLRKAVELLAKYADRLEKDLADLQGVCQVHEAAKPGQYWAVRYDGATFAVGSEGKVRRPVGLPTGRLPTWSDRIRTWPGGTVCSRRGQVFLLDAKTDRWVGVLAAAKTDAVAQWLGPATPGMLRCVRKRTPPGRLAEHLRYVAGAAGWGFHQFHGDFTVAANDRTRKAIDLPAAIAPLAPVKAPAGVAVYRVEPLNDRQTLIPTNVGLWLMGPDGGLRRVKMPLPDQNVMVSIMTWPKRKGRKYVGVAPQQGGQVIEIDCATAAVKPTGGYCGKGPDDAFAARRALGGRRSCERAIQHIYERRLAPATPK